MNIKNLIKKINLVSNPKIEKKDNFIESADHFHLTLTKEIARADRYNKKNTLILFNVYEYDINSIQTFIDILTSRIRFSDYIGWFDKKKIGVLLPDTTLEFAEKMAEEICKMKSSTCSQISYEVYMYPSAQWLSKIGLKR